MLPYDFISVLLLGSNYDFRDPDTYSAGFSDIEHLQTRELSCRLIAGASPDKPAAQGKREGDSGPQIAIAPIFSLRCHEIDTAPKGYQPLFVLLSVLANQH